ncbi:MAG: aminodeoxychorismate synthase component I [Emcibacter sp.]|nr:aminodeoxychorismate synthase component I [Emcibacter sp.]
MTQKPCDNFSVYLDNSRTKDARIGAYVFENPVAVVVAEKATDIEQAFEEIRRYLADGYYVAGWISYETGLFFEHKLNILGHSEYDTPFLSFGVYQNRKILNHEDNEAHWAEKFRQNSYAIENARLSLTHEQYEQAVKKIHDYLTAGDLYQVNFTLKVTFDFMGSEESYFSALRKSQRVDYGAFIKSEDLSVLSLSPELFFKKTDRKITVRPMKGTCPRGKTSYEDQNNADFMKNDDKNRAENLMIVDLLRNDLAKISSRGTVKLKSLYDIEKYQTLFQMTSTIESEVQDRFDLVAVVKALFPCGSVTGAPKIRAMEIIAELEQSPRGIYTGAIGYMAPDGDCCFSVPIRTMIVHKDGRGEMGIGSAIIADSDANDEYNECMLKAQFATRKFANFDLIETLRWSSSHGYSLLDLHLKRLKSSADYFDFVYDEDIIINDLNSHANYLERGSDWKVRLLLSIKGNISITSTPLSDVAQTENLMITLSNKRVNSQNVMLFHKTTDRKFYDQELKDHKKKYDSYDVIFMNEDGFLTEGAFNSIFLKQGDILYTPSLNSGLLNGTLRQSLMEGGSMKVREKNLTLSDLYHAEKIYMGNSVRGLMAVTFRVP